ncbi:(2Fe-2S)-binding protein [Roseiarcaceae bacterium H3SJ34-1]|uniref:(2Fe-2S)-binding protein n=1 Tax=Terripilifer ovatus TaxID=3032367 RepID=UPI003AB9A283|nr:(2Fe-2S)-binding protein [Roseiarcaceae bacterium H3SJ34-1]
MTESLRIHIKVNGRPESAEIAPNLMLVDFLREHLGLQGTKLACDQGACGACTVLLDGRPVTSCLTFAFAADGADLQTIEGASRDNGTLSQVQNALHDCGVPQCGFCTPGMVMMMEGFARQDPLPPGQTLETWMNANLCRCSGYQGFRRALDQLANEAGNP